MQKIAESLGTVTHTHTHTHTQVIINEYKKIKVEIENSILFLVNVKNSIKFSVSFCYVT